MQTESEAFFDDRCDESPVSNPGLFRKTRALLLTITIALSALAAILCLKRGANVAQQGNALTANVNLASAVLTNLEAMPQNASVGKLGSNLHEIRRVLEESVQEDATALPTALCVTDVMQSVSMIGQVGNVINAANKDCKSWKKVEWIKENGLYIDREHLSEADKVQGLKNMRDICSVGVSSSVALFGFIAATLADSARMCAGSIDPAKVAASPLYAQAGCAQDISLVSGGIAFFAAGAQTAALACDPHMPLADKLEALQLSLNQRRLHEIQTLPGLPRELEEPMLGPLGEFLLKYGKGTAQGRKDELRKMEQASCAFDVTGAASFAAAGGIFAHVASQECSPGMVQQEDGKMGCSLDISAIIGSWLSVAGQMGVLVAECPPPDETVSADQLNQGLCSSGVLNLMSAAAYMAAGLSDVKRSCGAIKPR